MVATLDLRRTSGITAGTDGRLGRDARSGREFMVVQVLRLALLFLVVANLGRIPVLSAGSKDAPILFNDPLVLAVVGAGAVAALRRRRFVLDAPSCVALLFALVGGLSAVAAVPRFGLTHFQLLFSLAYLARWLVYFGLYLVAINFVRRSDVESVWSALERAVLIFAGFGVFQSFFLPGFAQIVYSSSKLYTDWDPQGHRLVSTVLDPNYAGVMILIPLLILLARLSFGAKVASWKPLLLTAALILTVSRSSILAFLSGLMILAAVRGTSRRLLRFGALLMALLIPAIPAIISYASAYNKFSIDRSALSRITAWLTGIRIFTDHPVIGVGFNPFGFVQAAYGFKGRGTSSFGLEGGLLFIAVMTGVVGLTLYVGMLTLFVRRCQNVWRSAAFTAEERGLALGISAMTLALVVHSLFINSLVFPFVMEPMWVLWAFASVLLRDLRSQSGRPHEQLDAGPSGLPVAAGLTA